jgi:membrane protein
MVASCPNRMPPNHLRFTLPPSNFKTRMKWTSLKNAVAGAYKDIQRNHMLAIAAGLSYYFTLSLFPLLIFLAAALAYVPVPDLFNQTLELMAKFVPPESMGTVRQILSGVMNPPHGGLLSFGILATLWAATGGFSAMIEALNVAYDVEETRPYWKTRLLAFGLAFLVGALMLVGLTATMLGPHFGEWLANQLHVGALFAALWPYLRWAIIFGTIIFAVKLLFYWGPNVKQKFICTLPGAIIGVGGWALASYALGIYVSTYAHYNKTYGTLGGAIGLMLWFYVSATAILVGAEINSELLKAAGKRLPMKEPAPPAELPTAA